MAAGAGPYCGQPARAAGVATAAAAARALALATGATAGCRRTRCIPACGWAGARRTTARCATAAACRAASRPAGAVVGPCKHAGAGAAPRLRRASCGSVCCGQQRCHASRAAAAAAIPTTAATATAITRPEPGNSPAVASCAHVSRVPDYLVPCTPAAATHEPLAPAWPGAAVTLTPSADFTGVRARPGPNAANVARRFCARPTAGLATATTATAAAAAAAAGTLASRRVVCTECQPHAAAGLAAA